MKAAVRELWKKRERANDGRIYGDIVRLGNEDLDRNSVFQPVSHATLPVEILLPARFELFTDPVNAINAVSILEDASSYPRGTSVWIGMSALRKLDILGLVFLCSRIKSLNRVNCRVYGDYPVDSATKQLLDDVDFGGFLRGARHRTHPDGRQLDLIDSADLSRVDTRVGERIQDFLKLRNPVLSAEEVDLVYLAVIECLENIKAHAYTMDTGTWFVVGHHDEKTKTTSVAILDRGMGVVRSVTNNMKTIRRTLSKDADLFEEATKGRLTEHADPKRGKGFRFLREFALRGPGRKFHVLSSGRMITWMQDHPPIKRKLPEFNGTMVCIQIDNSDQARSS